MNPFDAYMDSEKWNFYEENDLLCRNTDGSLVRVIFGGIAKAILSIW